jgi:hypothetical protein
MHDFRGYRSAFHHIIACARQEDHLSSTVHGSVAGFDSERFLAAF